MTEAGTRSNHTLPLTCERPYLGRHPSHIEVDTNRYNPVIRAMPPDLYNDVALAFHFRAA